MNGWFIAIIILGAMDFAVAMVKHGERRESYNAGVTLVSVAIMIFLVYKAIQTGF